MRALCLLILMPLSSGAALNFVGEELQGASTPSLNITQSITLSAWVSVVSGNNGGGIFEKGRRVQVNKQNYMMRDSSGASKFIDFAYAAPDGSFHLFRSDNNYAAIGIRSNSIFHVGLIFEYGVGSGARMFVNGTNVPASWVGGTGNEAGLTNNEALFIGGEGPGGSVLLWSGLMNEQCIWSNKLTHIQMQMLGQSRMKGIAKQFLPTSLVYYIPMDDYVESTVISQASGKQMQDRSGKNNFIGSPNANDNPVIVAERWMSYQPNE